MSDVATLAQIIQHSGHEDIVEVAEEHGHVLHPRIGIVFRRCSVPVIVVPRDGRIRLDPQGIIDEPDSLITARYVDETSLRDEWLSTCSRYPA